MDHLRKIQAKKRYPNARKMCTVLATRVAYVFFPIIAGYRDFRKRDCVFLHSSLLIKTWDKSLALGAFYSIVFVPLQMVFPEIRSLYPGWKGVDILLDIVFTVDVCMKARTSYADHGYTITDPRKVLRHYASRWMIIDLLSSLPFDWMLSGVSAPDDSVDWQQIMKLFCLLRAGRLVRMLEGLEGSVANSLRILFFMVAFVLFGHWLGLFWYWISIKPLQDLSLVSNSSEYALGVDGRQWLWAKQAAAASSGEEFYYIMTRYICSLYWSLNVMTSLKGTSSHESRKCLTDNPDVLNPLLERVYTIIVFCFGAIAYSVIYGNIGQFVRVFYAHGDRYRTRITEINEFSNFHRLPKHVVRQIRAYVDFAFAVTKGINVDAIAHQLPANLQLEIHIHLNKKMVEQVNIFAGFPKDFFNILVTKLTPCIAIAGDHVFYAGDVGKRMYFVKRGTVEVRLGDVLIKSLKDGDYFGETALLTSQPRTADVCAACDCMLLSLTKDDLQAVLRAFPAAKARFEHSVSERLKDLQAKAKSDDLRTSTEISIPGSSPETQNGGSYNSRPRGRRSFALETEGANLSGSMERSVPSNSLLSNAPACRPSGADADAGAGAGGNEPTGRARRGSMFGKLAGRVAPNNGGEGAPRRRASLEGRENGHDAEGETAAPTRRRMSMEGSLGISVEELASLQSDASQAGGADNAFGSREDRKSEVTTGTAAAAATAKSEPSAARSEPAAAPRPKRRMSMEGSLGITASELGQLASIEPSSSHGGGGDSGESPEPEGEVVHAFHEPATNPKAATVQALARVEPVEDPPQPFARQNYDSVTPVDRTARSGTMGKLLGRMRRRSVSDQGDEPSTARRVGDFPAAPGIGNAASAAISDEIRGMKKAVGKVEQRIDELGSNIDRMQSLLEEISRSMSRDADWVSSLA
jgi:CRP-like cAMP-binding protein